jgi:hypothetical protein
MFPFFCRYVRLRRLHSLLRQCIQLTEIGSTSVAVGNIGKLIKFTGIQLGDSGGTFRVFVV